MPIIDTEISTSDTIFSDGNFDLDYGTPQSATVDCQGWTLADPIRQPRTEAAQDPESSGLGSSYLSFTYTIVWKLQLRKGRMMTLTVDTVEDVNIPSGTFWDKTLKPELLDVVEEKAPDPQFKPDDTRIIVSTSKRSQRDFHKRFSALHIDWNLVENKLQSWSHLGNNLTVEIWFIYKETQLDTTNKKKARKQLKRKASDPLSTTIHICPGHQDRGCMSGNPQKAVCLAEPARLKFPMPQNHCFDKGYHLGRLYEAQAVEAKMLATCGVMPGIALQFVGRIKKWLDELSPE
ncbi:hypothetical protein CI102_12158 [Trichoderma harzianum]|nr:hypothetical protein CI102_12158 [Trichoderma harzianum]